MRKIPAKLVLRDATLVAATLLLWALDARYRHAPGAFSVAVGLAAALGAVLCAYLAHEWGHLLGALSRGAAVHFAGRPTEVFLFRFDSERNGTREFLGMSYGGFLASSLVLVLYLFLLPLDALSGRVTLGLVLVGVALTAVVEVPIAWRVAHGAPIPRGAAYKSGGA